MKRRRRFGAGTDGRALWLVGAVLGAVLGALLVLAACSPLAALNALARSDSYRLDEGIAYGPLSRQKLDVYTPRRPPSSRRRAATRS